jgi:hypothetical protein
MTEDKVMMFHPSLLPVTADPIGSKRYKCCILHFKNRVSNKTKYNVKCYDDIFNKGIFLVDEYSPEFNDTVDVFEGTVLIEQNGIYSWWRNIL